MLALGVILASLVSLAYTATVGFSHISYARQRQSASGFANQAMEQIRALPFDTLKKGLGNADLGAMSDPLIVHSGVDYLYGAEKIPHGDNPTQAPLVPHRTTITNGTATAYTIAAYVTYYNNQLTSNTFRVTVLVAWTAKGKPSSVQAQSIFYSGSGCLSPATHPFAAPCQPFLFASAVADEGGIGFTGSISGVDFQEANLLLPGQTSDAQIEQISSVQGSSTPSGVTLTTAAQGKQSAGALK